MHAFPKSQKLSTLERRRRTSTSVAMKEELKNLLKVSIIVSFLTSYARFAAARTAPGYRRLLTLLPVISILPYLPCLFTTVHLQAISAFFLTWLAVFKLLLLSFALGPLSPSLPLCTFVSIASLPITLLRPNSTCPTAGLLTSVARVALLTALVSLYSYQKYINYYVLLFVISVHVYLGLEIVLAVAGAVPKTLLGLELEPHFNEPHRSDSLQDFWGKRWNKVVTGILRPAVFSPVRAMFGYDVGVIATFLVSGIMHEILVYYLTRPAPTGMVVGFFLMHGFCMVAEVRAKRAGWRPNTAVSGPAAVGFIMVSSFLLFFPVIMRDGVEEKALQESRAMVGFLVGSLRAVLGWMGLL